MAPQAKTAEPPQCLVYVLAWGWASSLLLGLVAGYVRYWLGFFVLAQGAGAGLLIAWLIGRMGGGRGAKPLHPGVGPALLTALACLACFLAAEAVGFGLAQPWFDPLGWSARVLEGRSAEYCFGIAATAGVHRGFVLGAGVAFGWS